MHLLSQYSEKANDKLGKVFATYMIGKVPVKIKINISIEEWTMDMHKQFTKEEIQI